MNQIRYSLIDIKNNKRMYIVFYIQMIFIILLIYNIFDQISDSNKYLKNTIKNGIIGIYKNEILEDTDERKKNKWINSN